MTVDTPHSHCKDHHHDTRLPRCQHRPHRQPPALPPMLPCKQASTYQRNGTEEKGKRVDGEVHENDEGLLMNDGGYRYLAMGNAKPETKNQ